MGDNVSRGRDENSLGSRADNTELQLTDLQGMHVNRVPSEYELSIDGGLSSIRGGPPSANHSGMLTMK